MASLTLPAPAKLNLFLAITGRRTDGFHELVSVVAPLAFGDSLTVETRAAPGYSLTCADPDVPGDDSNLVLKAARAFAAAAGWNGGAAFRLEKQVPAGAGLGGGSSDGVAALRALNRLAGDPLAPAQLAAVAAALGSDCPLFLQDGPVVMRGRGERVDALPPGASARLRGRRVLVFKPAFAIPTAWAYRRLADTAAEGSGTAYLAPDDAERRLRSWIEDPEAPAEQLLYNTLERPAFAKFLALPLLLDRLAAEFGLTPRMTGSGSACFAFLADDAPVAGIRAAIVNAWGDTAFTLETRLA